MKTLYIFGNGFDIAHGLNTRYSDFYNYLLEHKDTQPFLNKMIDAYGAYDKEWWNTFEKSLGDGFWFEVEFENMARCVIDDMVTDDGDEMPDVEYTLETHWEEYYRFMEKLNDYVLKWIFDSIDLSIVKPQVISLKESKDYFINFNYTMLLEEIYEIEAWNVFHVHGSIAEKNVIMGHDNLNAINQYKKKAKDAMENFDKNSATVDSAIASFYEATLKDTEKIINETYFWHRLDNVERIVIYGHSLGSVDMPYFKKIQSSISVGADWYVYNFDMSEESINNIIISLGVKPERIHILPAEDFFVYPRTP